MRLLLLQSALGGLFLLQQRFYAAPSLIDPTSGGVLDPVAAVVAGLPSLGGFPKLTPQAFRTVIQPTADKFFRRRRNLFF